MSDADFYKHVWVVVRLREISVDFRVLQLDVIYFFSFKTS